MTDSRDEPAVECRPIPDDRREDYQRIVEYAFEPESGPATPDDQDDADDIGTPFGAFDGDDLVSVCKHYDFTARLRDDWVPLAGLASVATPPEHRRQGHVRALIEYSLEQWREEYPLAALWPFDRGYYRQFGWATANKSTMTFVPPEQLALGADGSAGTLRPVTADDWESLQDAHEAHAADRTLTLRRDEDWWREKVFGDDQPHAYAYECDGAVRGYALFEFEQSGSGLDERRLKVSDLAFADHEVLRRLLGLFADHDSQANEVRLSMADASLLDMVDDPGEAQCGVHAGPMVRVVDVPHALSTVTYPDDVTADLTLAVTDETAPWNDDVFRLDVSDGDGVCTRNDAPRSDADASVDVGTLSQLVVGYHSAPEARRLATLDVRSEGVADRLAALFPLETVFLRTFF